MARLQPFLRSLAGSLTGRVFSVALLATLVFGISFAIASRTFVTVVLRSDLRARAAALGDGLRATAADAVATGDTVGLHLLLREVADSNPHVRYIAVFDGSGHLAAHTFARSPSPRFVATIRAGERGKQPIALDTERGVIHDVIIPGRSGGAEVHVGIAESWVAETIDSLSVIFASAAAASLLAGLLIAWHISRRIARPLRNLAVTADAIARATTGPGPDALAALVDAAPATCGIDEVDALARSLHDITTSLRDSQTRLGEAQRLMIRTERMAAIGAFVAGTAHAINNPLGGVRACLEMIEANPGDAGKLRRYSGIAYEGLGRIEVLVRKLMQFVREGAGLRVRFDVNDVIASSLIAGGAVGRAGRGATVQLNLAGAACTVVGDASEIEQALTSLVINALQASPAAGVVEVTTQLTPDARIRIDVEDQGPGVPLALRDKVFEPFFTTKPEGEGTGLGLWVVWGVVERHGGRVAVTETEGGGARFSVWLPAATAQPTATTAGVLP